MLRIVSAFPEADGLMDPRDLRSRFEITHVLEARLQRTSVELTVDAVLIETRSGLQIWAQQFATPAGAGEQEILLHKMIRQIEPRIMQAMAVEMQTDRGEPSARTNLMQAIVLLALKGWHRNTFIEATAMIERSIEQAPEVALSHAYLALLKALGHRVGLLRDDDAIVPSVLAAVERALELENRDSTILGLVGCALADIGQVDRAMPILMKAIEANPQNGHARTALGSAYLMKGDHAAAVRHLTEGIECSPADSRRSVWGAALALAHLARGELGEAQDAAESACREDDRLLPAPPGPGGGASGARRPGRCGRRGPGMPAHQAGPGTDRGHQCRGQEARRRRLGRRPRLEGAIALAGRSPARVGRHTPGLIRHDNLTNGRDRTN